CARRKLGPYYFDYW
nr:immunoglobulin heavy chain junction region [Mus musculus]